MEVALKKYFGYSSLRHSQKEVIEQLLDGRDCLVVMATGSGKSLCYQIPPLVTKRTAIVVSPLLSLMQDQVMSLKQKGVKSDYLGSTQMNSNVTRDAQEGLYDVVYMTPEKACSLHDSFWSKLLARGVSLLAVDEAHCISEWGHDFRIEYKKLHLLRKKLPGVPFVALTATATERVRKDIKASLCMDDPHIYIGTFDRPNLYYGAKLCEPKSAFIAEVVKDVAKRFTARESTIIYCTTIRETEQIHDALTNHGISSGMYHGKMDSKAREKAHRAFVTDEVLVMVATIAFGMGIDKPDVRCVIHYGCPKSLESYYQESGRCGRDGLPSVCLLYYSRSDFTKADFYCSVAKSVQQKTAIHESYIAGQKYCLLGSCRRQNLLLYFGEGSLNNCGNCDNCTSTDRKQRDLSKESLLLLECVSQCGGRWGLGMPVSVLRGSHAKKLVANNFHRLGVHGSGRKYPQNWWKGLGGLLAEHGFLEESVNGTFRHTSVSEKGMKFLEDSKVSEVPLVLKLTPEMATDEYDISDANQLTNEPCPMAEEPFFTQEESLLYQMLLKVRTKLAQDNSTAPYTICGDQVLRNFTKYRPSSVNNVALIDGVNMNFIENYSRVFIHEIIEISSELNLQLDNMLIEDFSDCLEGDAEDALDETIDDEPDCDLEQYIMQVLSSHDGLRFEDIVQKMPGVMEECISATLDELEFSFEIYKKNSLYFVL